MYNQNESGVKAKKIYTKFFPLWVRMLLEALSIGLLLLSVSDLRYGRITNSIDNLITGVMLLIPILVVQKKKFEKYFLIITLSLLFIMLLVVIRSNANGYLQ